jgi:hypothetical protein
MTHAKFIFPGNDPFDLKIDQSITRNQEVFCVANRISSCWLRDFYGVSSGVLRELPKVSERIPEEFPKKTLKREETDTKNLKNLVLYPIGYNKIFI